MTPEGGASTGDRVSVPALDADGFARSVRALEVAAEAATAHDEPTSRAALAHFALVACFVGRLDDAARSARLLAERADAAGDGEARAQAELALAVHALFLGEHADARAHLARAERTGGGSAPRAYAMAVAAELALYEGEDAAAESLALAAASAAADERDALAAVAASWVAGLAAARLRRAQDARSRLRTALERAEAARDARAQLRALEAIGLIEFDPPGAATALRLLTAAGRHHRRLGLTRPRALERWVDLRTNELRYQLGEWQFEEGTHVGTTLSIAGATELAGRALA